MEGNGGVPAKFDEAMAPIQHARHAPAYVYTSQQVLDYEKETIFLKDWLCIGREEEIEKPGDYLTFDVVGEPIVVVRTQNGEINAFSNICLHRGVRIVEGSGNKRGFSCPFHGWSYKLEGRLIGAPHMKDVAGFDLSAHRLAPIRVETWKRWLFVTFDANGAPLADHVAGLERDFGYLRQEDFRLGIKTENEVPCNWKLVCENLIDYYHIPIVHRKTNGRTFTMDSFKFEPRENGGYVAMFNSGPSTPSGKPVFGRTPWLQDKPDDFSTGGRLWPNLNFFARIDTVHPIIVWPISPDRCRMIVYTLIPKDYMNEPDFAERVKAYRQYQNDLYVEDAAMLESMQHGLHSQRFRPGRMSYVERGVQHVIKSFLERLEGMSDAPARGSNGAAVPADRRIATVRIEGRTGA
jgi:choline monooxygenase